MAIPNYPQFKKLDIGDKIYIERYTSNYDPYSDFNFTSLWSYDTLSGIEISYLYDNLVVKFTDYLTSQHFYSFIGTNRVENTIIDLLSRQPQVLKLVPQIVIDSANTDLHTNLLIKEDDDNHDYILSTKDLSLLSGNKLRGKRNFLKRFKNLYPNHYWKLINISDLKVQDRILKLFYIWEVKQNRTREETQIELTALTRLLKIASVSELVPIGIYVDDELIAFSINEVIGNYAIIHFEKANIDFIGSFQYLKHRTGHHFYNLKIPYINYEQDLGIDGLRKAKKSWKPIKYLKKYIISHKQK